MHWKTIGNNESDQPGSEQYHVYWVLTRQSISPCW